MPKHIKVNGQTAKELYEEVQQAREEGFVGKIDLVFSKDAKLWHGNKQYRAGRGGYKEGKTHTVKNVWWLEKRSGSLLYTPTTMKTRGYFLGSIHMDMLAEIVVMEGQVDFSVQWANIAASMREHNLNIQMAEYIEAHLRGEEEHIRGMQNYWKRTDKPRTMSFKDVTGGLSLAEMAERATNPSTLTNGQRYFRATKAAWSRRGNARDRSVHLSVLEDGTYHATAASEYAGCGNGDYYIMYSPTRAFYAETD